MRWDDARYRRMEVTDPAIRHFLDCIGKTHVNGGVILACLAGDSSDVDRVAASDFHGPDDPLRALVGSRSVIDAVPELKIDQSKLNLLKLTRTTLPEMQGALTQILVDGGAYVKFEGNINEAKTIVRDFVAALIDDRFGETRVAVSYDAWTDWFCGVAWDMTYIGYDASLRSFWLLCITDTD